MFQNDYRGASAPAEGLGGSIWNDAIPAVTADLAGYISTQPGEFVLQTKPLHDYTFSEEPWCLENLVMQPNPNTSSTTQFSQDSTLVSGSFNTYEDVDPRFDKLLVGYSKSSSNKQLKIPGDSDLFHLHKITHASTAALKDWFWEYMATRAPPKRQVQCDPSRSYKEITSPNFDPPGSSSASRTQARKPPLVPSHSRANEPLPTFDFQSLLADLPNTPYQLSTGASTGQICSVPRSISIPAPEVGQTGSGLTPALRRLIEEVVHGFKNCCPKPRGRKKRKGIFSCTLGCPQTFKDIYTWRRHEETTSRRNFWFCTKCGDAENPSADLLFQRQDKIVEHVRIKHADWSKNEALEECKVNYTPSFRQKCKFCNRIMRSWKKRFVHEGKHIRDLNRKKHDAPPPATYEKDDDSDDRLPDSGTDDDDNGDDDDDSGGTDQDPSGSEHLLEPPDSSDHSAGGAPQSNSNAFFLLPEPPFSGYFAFFNLRKEENVNINANSGLSMRTAIRRVQHYPHIEALLLPLDLSEGKSSQAAVEFRNVVADNTITSVSGRPFVKVNALKDWLLSSSITPWFSNIFLLLKEHASLAMLSRDVLNGQNESLLVFSILLLLRRGHLLPKFMEAGIVDRTLPASRKALSKVRLLLEKLDWSVVHDFEKLQWSYCAAVFGESQSQTFGDRILPFVKKERVNKKGGMAKVFEVEVLEEFLSPRLRVSIPGARIESARYGTTYRIALKQFRSTDYVAWGHEMKILSEMGQHDAIIHYLGAFSHLPSSMLGEPHSYNILLESAECDLNEWFADQLPPKSEDDIIRFWQQLQQIVEALSFIHGGQAFVQDDGNFSATAIHADIKPDNILAFTGTATGDVSFKLADFGLSHIQSGPKHASTKIRGGTRAYGAPESDHASNRSYDIWSLGCVFLEAATWLNTGWEGLKEFQKLTAIGAPSKQDYRNLRSVGCFHDGFNVLPQVKAWHRRLWSIADKRGTVTARILTLINNQMLVGNPLKRSTAAQISDRLKQILGSEPPQPSVRTLTPHRLALLDFRETWRAKDITFLVNVEGIQEKTGLIKQLYETIGAVAWERIGNINLQSVIHKSGNKDRFPSSQRPNDDEYKQASPDACDTCGHGRQKPLEDALRRLLEKRLAGRQRRDLFLIILTHSVWNCCNCGKRLHELLASFDNLRRKCVQFHFQFIPTLISYRKVKETATPHSRIDSEDEDNRTLSWAARHGHQATFQVPVEAKADVGPGRNGRAPHALPTPLATPTTDSQALLSAAADDEWSLLRKRLSSTARSTSPDTISSAGGPPHGPHPSLDAAEAVRAFERASPLWFYSPSPTNSSSTTPLNSHEDSPCLLWSPPQYNAQQVGHPAHLAGAGTPPAAPASQQVGGLFNSRPNISTPTVPIATYSELIIDPLAGCFGTSFSSPQSLGSPFDQDYHPHAPQGYNIDALSPFHMSLRAFTSRPETVPLFRETRIPEHVQLDEEVKQGRVHAIRFRTAIGRSNRSSSTKDSRKPNFTGFYSNSPVQTEYALSPTALEGGRNFPPSAFFNTFLYSNGEMCEHSGTHTPVQFEMTANPLAAGGEQPRQISHQEPNASARSDGSKKRTARRPRNSTGNEISEDHLRCPICGKPSGKKKDVERHMRSHRKVKGYGCDRCHKQYTRLDNLQRHQSAHHGRQAKGILLIAIRDVL